MVSVSLRALAATLVVGGLLAWLIWPTSEDSSAALRVEVEPQRESSAARGIEEQAAERSSVTLEPAAPLADENVRTWPELGFGEYAWIGRVVDLDGEPVPEAEVLVSLGNWNTTIPTDDQARFFWKKYHGRRYGGPSFTAIHRGQISKSARAPAANPPARIELVLEPAQSFAMRVVDESDGGPVSGVRVVARLGSEKSQATSNDDGLLELPISDGGLVEITVLPTGPVIGMRLERSIDLATREVLVIEVQRYPRRAALHAVDHETGHVIQDAKFHLARVPNRPGLLGAIWDTEPLDSNGGVVQVELAADSNHGIAVVAEAEGYFQAACSVIADQADPTLLSMKRLPRTAVRVVAGGNPIDFAVTLEWSMKPIYSFLPKEAWHRGMVPLWAGFPGLSGSVRTAVDGTAWLPIPTRNMAPEVFELVLRGPGGLRRDYGELMFRNMPEPPWLLDIAPSKGTVRFRVVDERGDPVAGVEVAAGAGSLGRDVHRYQDSVRWAGEGRRRSEQLGLEHFGVTDEAGEVSFEMFAPSRPYGSVDWRGKTTRVRSEENILEPGATMDLEFSLEEDLPSLSLRGRAVPRSGVLPMERWYTRILARRVVEPSRDAELRLHASPQARIEVDGTFEIEGLEPGRYEVVVPWSREETKVEAVAGDEGLVVLVPPVQTLRIEVVSAITGERIPGAELWLTGGHANASLGRDRGDNDGLVVFERLAADFNRLVVSRAGFATSTLTLSDTVAQPVHDLRVELTPARILVLSFVTATGDTAESVHRVVVRRVGSDEVLKRIRVIRDHGLAQWPAAPMEALSLQPVDRSGNPVGDAISIPAGSERVQRRVLVPL